MIRSFCPAAAIRPWVVVTLLAGLAFASPISALGQSTGNTNTPAAMPTPPPTQTTAAQPTAAQPTAGQPVSAQTASGQTSGGQGNPGQPASLQPIVPGSAPVLQPVPVPNNLLPAPISNGTAPTPTERIDALENQNREMSQQLTVLSKKYEALLKVDQEIPASFEQFYLDDALQDDGAGTLQSAPSDWPPGTVGTRRRGPLAQPLSLGGADVDLSDGIHFQSKDGFYRIEMHDLTQFDVRTFSPTGSQLVNNFVIPRQRLYFSGEIGDNWLFYSVLNRGYGSSVDILDSFAEYRLNSSFHLRTGRYKVPFNYEYYKIDEASLLAGERSVFVGNLSGNRQLGVMGYGRLLDERFEYAIGAFAGPQNGFQGFDNQKSTYMYVNARPFLLSDIELLKNLNIGAAYDWGIQNDPLEPNAFHTANDESTSANVNNVSPTFLEFNSKATMVGMRSFWTGDANWYYKNMTATAQYNGGYITYEMPVTASRNVSIHVPFSGYSMGVTYFATGEQITSRKGVTPLHDFKISNFLANSGAFEFFSRWSNLTAGQQIYNDGLVNPNLWSRSAVVLDNGVNWYANKFVRITTEWQLSEFSSPVQLSGNVYTNQINMFWFRTQIFY